MDVGQRLPERPILEQFRPLDRTTANMTGTAAAPPYWRDMSYRTGKSADETSS
ncbi:hypothetical protein D3C85_1724810 [compost metagenome]